MCFKKLLLTFCLIFFIYSCENDSTIVFLDTNISVKNNSIVEVNIPIANGNAETSSLINTTIENTIISSLQIGGTKDLLPKSIEESISTFNSEYKEFITDFPDSLLHWEAQIDGEVVYQSPRIISIAITSYINTGGAHGNLNISFKNFNAVTGTLIPNKNLIKNIDEFKKLALPRFKEAIKEKDYAFESKSFELPVNMAYGDAGIILLYNTYEIAPYSTGIIEFTIPYNEVNPLLIFEGS